MWPKAQSTSFHLLERLTAGSAQTPLTRLLLLLRDALVLSILRASSAREITWSTSRTAVPTRSETSARFLCGAAALTEFSPPADIPLLPSPSRTRATLVNSILHTPQLMLHKTESLASSTTPTLLSGQEATSMMLATQLMYFPTKTVAALEMHQSLLSAMTSPGTSTSQSPELRTLLTPRPLPSFRRDSSVPLEMELSSLMSR